MIRPHPSVTVPLVTAVLLGVLTASPKPSAFAADPLVPPAVQAALTIRVLEYDRSLRSWAGSDLSVGLVARRGEGVSEYGDGLEGRSVQGVPLTVHTHVYQNADSLARWIGQEGIRLVYVSPGLGGDAKTVISAATTAKLPSLTATREDFESGATLGIVVQGGKPHILVRLPGSKAVGMSLDPKLLQLAEVVR